MTQLDPNYVLVPLDVLLAECHSNVFMGLRIVEQVQTFPPPTPEELQFMQLSFNVGAMPIEATRNVFKKWILVNGFEDVHKAIRHTLERVSVFKSVQKMIADGALTGTIEEHERDMRAHVSRLHLPELLEQSDSLLRAPFKYRPHVESFNAARNVLEHTGGIVTPRHCTDAARTKLVLRGNRFKLFFKKDGEETETPAVLGQPGPENAALMLGAEEFQIEFVVGQPIQLSLKEFIDVLNTCVFIRAEIASELQ